MGIFALKIEKDFIQTAGQYPTPPCNFCLIIRKLSQQSCSNHQNQLSLRATPELSFNHVLWIAAVYLAVIMGHECGCSVSIKLILTAWITDPLTIHNVIQQHVVCYNRCGGRWWPCVLIRGWSYDYRSRSGLPGMRQLKDCMNASPNTKELPCCHLYRHWRQHSLPF